MHKPGRGLENKSSGIAPDCCIRTPDGPGGLPLPRRARPQLAVAAHHRSSRRHASDTQNPDLGRHRARPETTHQRGGRRSRATHCTAHLGSAAERVFEFDITLCPHCGGRLRVIADVTDPDIIRQILDHIQQRAPPRLPHPANDNAHTHPDRYVDASPQSPRLRPRLASSWSIFRRAPRSRRTPLPGSAAKCPSRPSARDRPLDDLRHKLGAINGVLGQVKRNRGAWLV
jgi:hypothetical protein